MENPISIFTNRTLNLNDMSYSESQLYNKIATEVRSNFHLLIDSIAKGKESNLHWIISSLASRNKSESPLFIRLCKIILIKRAIEDGYVKKIILSDFPLYILIKKHYQVRDLKTDIICTETFLERILRVLRPFMRYFQYVLLIFKRYYAKSNQKRKKIKDEQSITLLDTFIINSKIGEQGSLSNGKYQDRYYPGLINSLENQERENLFYLPTPIGFNNYKGIFKEMRASQDNFIIRDDYLKAVDYLKMLFHPLKKLMLDFHQLSYQDFDITPLIVEENWQNSAKQPHLEGLVNYYFAFRLSKEKVKVRLLIEWFENQIIDRGAIVGFHRFMADTKIIGYQGFIISQKLHHYVNPSNSELISGAVPDEIAVIGKGLVENVQEFCSKLNVITAPAFRNQNVWQNVKSKIETNKIFVLVALPMDKAQEAIILSVISKLQFDKNTTIWIKPHPTYGTEHVNAFIAENKLPFHTISGYFNDFLERSNVLISNASVTPVEAVAKGIPAIIIGDYNGVTQNPIPQNVSSEIWRICFTANETQSTLDYFLEEMMINPLKYSKIGESIRNEYFEQVTKEKVRHFLKMDN